MADEKVGDLAKQIAVSEAIAKERWDDLYTSLRRIDDHLKQNEKTIIELSKTMETSKGALKALGLISAVLGIFILVRKVFGV